MAKQVAQLEALFKALADGTRLRILGLLLTGEVCVCHIHESLKIPQSKASRHLAYLRNAGLVDTRRDGLWIHYRLATADDRIVRTIDQTVRHVLGHVPEVRQDLARLAKRTGCCLPDSRDETTFACCMPAESTVATGPTSVATLRRSDPGASDRSGQPHAQ